MRLLVLTLLFLIAAVRLAPAQPAVIDDMLLDATWVTCSDTTESLFIYTDGRAVYARFDQGVMLDLGSALMNDLDIALRKATSRVDTSELDSCATLGLVLAGPRYLLINSGQPSPQTIDLYRRLDRLRKYGRRQLETMERLVKKADEGQDVSRDVSIDSVALQRQIKPSSVAREWGCRGHVVVAARIAYDGRIRAAFVDNASVHGKCAALLTSTALRAVMRSTFAPALDVDGHPTAAWIRVEFTFGPGVPAGRTLGAHGR